MGYLFRSVKDVCHFHKMGCFKVFSYTTHGPFILDWAIQDYGCDADHEIHVLISTKVVFQHSFNASQVTEYGRYYATFKYKSTCSPADCAVIYYAKISQCVLVSDVKPFLAVAAKCGVATIKASALKEEFVEKKKRA